MRGDALTEIQKRNVAIASELVDAVVDEGLSGLRRVGERFDDFCQPGYEWRPLMSGLGQETYVGEDGFGTYVDDLESTMSEMGLTVAEIRAIDDDHVLAVGRLHLTGRESGVPVDSEWAVLFRLEAGLLASGTTFLSHAEAEKAATSAAA